MPNFPNPGHRPCGCGKPRPVPPPPPPHPGPCPEPPICQPFTPTEFQFMSIEDVEYLMQLIKNELDAQISADKEYAANLVAAEETDRKAADVELTASIEALTTTVADKANSADVYSKADADAKFFLQENVATTVDTSTKVPNSYAVYNALQDKLDASLNPAEVGKFLTVGNTGAIISTVFQVPNVPDSPEEGDSYSLAYSDGAWSWIKN